MTFLKRLKKLSLPLLTKELHEQSARLRTFVLRVVYALLLFFAVGLFNVDQYFMANTRGFTINSMLGVGRQIFLSILWLQFVGVYLFLPAMVCGVLTVEKERNTLGLLLITKLGQWTIIFEKFASRVVPMFAIVLISLPLMSFTYALGGLESKTLFMGLWFLVLTIVQIAALAVLASSFFSGTVGAFLGTYFLLGVLTLGPPLLDELILNHSIREFARELGRSSLQWLFQSNTSLEHILGEMALGMFLPPLLFQYNMMASDMYSVVVGLPGGATTSGLRHPILFAFISGIPSMICAWVSLSLARYFLVRRAFISSTNPILSLFKWLDRVFVRANDRLLGGATLVKESQLLPGLNPVAWRETAKRSLGQFRYLVRVFVTLMFPTTFFVFLAATGPSGRDASSGPVSGLMFLLWIISVVLIAVTASNLIAGERSRQSLDVLLTTPISSREIVLQKLRGVQRLMIVCSIPLLTCIGFQTWWRTQLTHDPYASGSISQAPPYDWLEYSVTAVVTLFILFHLTMWMAFWIGMRMKSTSKAIMTTLGVLVGLCALPPMLMMVTLIWVYQPYNAWTNWQSTGLMSWFLCSPATLVVHAEFESLRHMHPIPYFPVIVNSLIYGSAWLLIRYRVLARADDGLVRIKAEVNKTDVPS